MFFFPWCFGIRVEIKSSGFFGPGFLFVFIRGEGQWGGGIGWVMKEIFGGNWKIPRRAYWDFFQSFGGVIIGVVVEVEVEVEVELEDVIDEDIMV